MNNYSKVPCKRRSSVNSGAWLRRFDYVTGVEKVALQKQKMEKKVKEKCCIIPTLYAFPPNMECMEVCFV